MQYFLKIKRFILPAIFIFINVFAAKSIPPEFSLKASGGVYDFVVDGNILYAATDAGIIDVFNFKTKKEIKKIQIPDIKDFNGESVPPKLFSVDKLNGIDGILAVSQGTNGFRNVFLYRENKLVKILSSEKDKLFVKRATFIDKNLIMLGLLSNELILFDINNKKQIYRKQLSTAVFSDFTTDFTRKITVTCEESGIIRAVNSHTGQIMGIFSGMNLDNVFKVAYADLTFITAGQDRKVGVYKWGSEQYYLNSDFIVYCVGIDKQAKFGAYSANENNDIYVFDTDTRQILYKLKGQKSTQTKIYFLSGSKIISSSEDEYIMFWKLK